MSLDTVSSSISALVPKGGVWQKPLTLCIPPNLPNHVIITRSRSSTVHVWETVRMGRQLMNPMTMQWAIPIDDEIDPSSIRTSQRAELLAAVHGICKLAEFKEYSNTGRNARGSQGLKQQDNHIDSEYVVVGMTQWVPAWKGNGWRNSSKRRPNNLDLFRRLDAAVERYKHEHNVRIAFWHIRRVHNDLADELAGIAARGQTIEAVELE